ncbi:hypothetical protein [Streptococcus iniae]|uniref:Uncharacterized protein n=1 Tax=Streptococcus iniae TaxID=1346 RepID=A0A3L8GP60_STRIN|nr:hypothetical protein [Streptococcus iniae]AGM98138.1 hypothetical protein K710_0336 [Streptococcus iniae SF1]AHY15206.1 hypothetical protein DQ08_01615 [Streptococcus iniae]AHY17074.1 hypothetical protein DW64_01600 [Streptococcus iniae]AJG25389.1 hypothetical protein SI82_01900 [Streptococcus iniae]APD31261.1 hypothetical protein BMF34_01795 [Streptococcus iniae]
MTPKKPKMLFTLVALSILGMIGTSPVKAESPQGPSIKAEAQESKAVAVSSQFRKDQPIVDVSINIGDKYTQAGKVTINLQDKEGKTLVTIPFDLPEGAKSMTAWFDMTGMASGDYTISVGFQNPTGSYQAQTEAFTYTAK